MVFLFFFFKQAHVNTAAQIASLHPEYRAGKAVPTYVEGLVKTKYGEPIRMRTKRCIRHTAHNMIGA